MVLNIAKLSQNVSELFCGHDFCIKIQKGIKICEDVGSYGSCSLHIV